MKNTAPAHIRDLLDRIARITAAQEWSDALNPAQRGALAYLARANKFSRAPSNVADFMCTTRGTASQTLKALESKGFVVPARSSTDRRSISYVVTDNGHAALNASSDLDATLDGLPAHDADALASTLALTMRDLLKRRGYRSFGVCNTCRHHLRTKEGRTCLLLDVSLTEEAANELCHEHLLEESGF